MKRRSVGVDVAGDVVVVVDGVVEVWSVVAAYVGSEEEWLESEEAARVLAPLCRPMSPAFVVVVVGGSPGGASGFGVGVARVLPRFLRE